MKQVKPYSFEQVREQLRHAIDRSKGRHRRWRTLEVLYRTGDVKLAEEFYAKAEAGTLTDIWDVPLDQHVVNLALPHLNLIVSSVTARDPKHIATPLGGGDEAEVAAKVAEQVVDYYWLRTHATEKLGDATWDLVRLGNGFLKIGWAHESFEEDRDELEIAEEFAELVAADAQLSDLEGTELTDLAALGEHVALTNTVIERDEPYVEYVSPYDVFVPPNARRMNETRWVAQRVTLPVDEILANDAYDTDEHRLKKDGSRTGNDQVSEWRRKADDEAWLDETGAAGALETATLWEFYDLRSGHLMVLQIDGDKPLYEGPMPWSHTRSPFVHLRGYSEDGNEFWAFGALENVAHAQAMFNEMWTEQLENARRSGTKYVAEKEILTEEVRTALMSDESEIVVPVEADGQPVGELISALPRAALPAEVFQSRMEAEEFIKKTLGINDFQAGGVGSDRMSATAAAVVDGVASLRAQDMVAAVENGASDTAAVLLLLCQEFLDIPRVIRVTGTDGSAWPQVSAADLRGEFLMKIEGGSLKAINPATLEQRGLRTLSQVAPALASIGMDPQPAVRQALRDMGYDPDQMMKPLQAPPPAPTAPGAGGEGDPVPADVTAAGGPPTSADAQTGGEVFL